MAVQFPIIGADIPLEAGADLSTHQYKFVVIDSAGKIALAGLGAKAIGVLQDKPAASGRSGSVRINGVSKVVASAAIAAGAFVGSTAAGKAKTVAITEGILGIALDAAGADLEVIAVALKDFGPA